jgi:hypothetical protein
MMVLAGTATYHLFRSPHKKALTLILNTPPIALPLFLSIGFAYWKFFPFNFFGA